MTCDVSPVAMFSVTRRSRGDDVSQCVTLRTNFTDVTLVQVLVSDGTYCHFHIKIPIKVEKNKKYGKERS